MIQSVCNQSPALSKVQWNGSCRGIFQCGQDFCGAPQLTQIYLDGVEFSCHVENHGRWVDYSFRPQLLLFINKRAFGSSV